MSFKQAHVAATFQCAFEDFDGDVQGSSSRVAPLVENEDRTSLAPSPTSNIGGRMEQPRG